jgi:DnaJ-domain-containing protein 1
LIKERLEENKQNWELKKENLPKFIIFIIVAVVTLVIGTVYELLFFYMFGVVLMIAVPIIFQRLSRVKISFYDTDRHILIIAYHFLKHCDIEPEQITAKLKQLFSGYPEEKLLRLLDYIIENKKDYKIACQKLSGKEPKIRYYAIYSLMDMASEDLVFSLKEEAFIDGVRQLLKIHPLTFQTIKNAYLKKGLKEERQLLEEEARRQAESEICAFDAYRVLGVTPGISLVQLKAVYYRLAKQFHPDKHIGKSKEEIEQNEAKFREIATAYNILLSDFKKKS